MRMKDLREETITEACLVGNIVEPGEIGWTHG